MKLKKFEFNMFPVNCYLLWDDTKEAIVIDPGCYYNEEKQSLKNFILDNQLCLTQVINTHLHLDHIFGNPFMLREFNLHARANPLDEYWLKEAHTQCQMFGIKLQDEPVPLGEYLYHGDVVRFGNTQLKVIQVPGHSPGSLIFYCKEENCVFVGDVLFQGSIGRTDLLGGNYHSLIDNITNRLFTLPPNTVVYPGHGPHTSIEQEKRTNPFFQ